MYIKGISVFGIYETRAGVENAVTALKMAQYDSANISVLFPFNKDAAHEAETRSPEGVAGGVVAGGVLGAVVGMGLLGIPGVGPFLAAGPVVAALSFAGGIAGGLIEMGISDVEAKKYESKIRKNGILLSVHNLSSVTNIEVLEILKLSGAEDVTSTSEERNSNAGVSEHSNDETIIENVPAPTALQNSPLPPIPEKLNTAEKQKASEYLSPSQPLGVPSIVAK